MQKDILLHILHWQKTMHGFLSRFSVKQILSLLYDISSCIFYQLFLCIKNFFVNRNQLFCHYIGARHRIYMSRDCFYHQNLSLLEIILFIASAKATTSSTGTIYPSPGVTIASGTTSVQTTGNPVLIAFKKQLLIVLQLYLPKQKESAFCSSDSTPFESFQPVKNNSVSVSASR